MSLLGSVSDGSGGGGGSSAEIDSPRVSLVRTPGMSGGAMTMLKPRGRFGSSGAGGGALAAAIIAAILCAVGLFIVGACRRTCGSGGSAGVAMVTSPSRSARLLTDASCSFGRNVRTPVSRASRRASRWVTRRQVGELVGRKSASP